MINRIVYLCIKSTFETLICGMTYSLLADNYSARLNLANSTIDARISQCRFVTSKEGTDRFAYLHQGLPEPNREITKGFRVLPLLKDTAEKPKPVSWRSYQKIITMPQLINYGKEMLRISPKGIECSTNNGRSWITRYTGSSCGTFIDLLPYGNELLAVTSKGVYCSTNEGRSWISRYVGSSCGTFISLADGGRELMATTSKGLYCSTNSGRSWIKR